MSMVTKNKFSQLNDKKFYFPNRVVSLPFHHPPWVQAKKRQRIEKYFWEKIDHLLRLENEALRPHPRLYLIHQILMSPPKIFIINQKSDFNQHTKTLLKKMQ